MPNLPPGVTRDRRTVGRRRYLRRASDRLAARLAEEEDPIYKGDYFKERRRRDRRLADRRGLAGHD
ncbi:MAG: hypothetical protein COW73_01385 [Nitrospirae bacterium CG18_big_fil_WC_8_21_14_2_50_70_55]|nr:hypothetical protein [Deltaproteobacteria bacterium]OIP67606.1 MAG: hypothetical protein AUK30_00465 [Nitrospirae bacterium CG2_30_70_394]PIQ06988.1 MAG: hypothetical protein COW73_01385 [Nitrospirae bacterium CG18_big_fil_WC_8_21_14_2_50_70_55]PIU79907.1 MAG: hypothetical protein COS73_02020 [Nitrospirae bacterium CG06_land_8_20_14_3_00_70_43]PIW82059.1 MAG: hypothetical protein COZ96_10660 [Nitrospirae bacterium CG_4_8_14_3_um_filter_70_85]PIX83286.1 MAG: hypothetical protein COZ33_06260 